MSAIQLLLGLCFAMVVADTVNITPGSCPGNNKVLGVLPLDGWDNLQNVAMNRIYKTDYKTCKTTADKEYLLPDGFAEIDVKESVANIYSELIQSVQDYTDMTANSINVQFHASEDTYGKISGSFSDSNKFIRKFNQEHSTLTSRVQVRYSFYVVESMATTPLDDSFESRVLEIAAYLSWQCNDTATYLSQLLIRDYGTHVLTRVKAGVIVAKEDQISTSLVTNVLETSRETSYAASVSFMETFGGSAQYTTKTSSEYFQSYLHNIFHSQIHLIGGPPYKFNMTLNDIVDLMGNNLVPIDREGDPLDHFITKYRFPSLAHDLVVNTANIVQEAIKYYYKHNLYEGCTDRTKQHYNPIANFPKNDLCESSYNNYTFGGMFQVCEDSNCDASAYPFKNPLTGAHTCPQHYTKTILYSELDCKGFVVVTYWCNAPAGIPKNTGYLFGGLYTKRTVNFLTGKKQCPEFFFALGMSDDMFACVSDDYELGFQLSIAFGGFFSCAHGNPLASAHDKHGRYHRNCPKGYSQHLWAIKNSCEIYYCLLAGAFAKISLPVIRRPPYDSFSTCKRKSTLSVPAANAKMLIQNSTSFDWFQLDLEDAKTYLENDHLPEHEKMMLIQKRAAKAASEPSGLGNSNGGNANIGAVAVLSVVLTIGVGSGGH